MECDKEEQEDEESREAGSSSDVPEGEDILEDLTFSDED